MVLSTSFNGKVKLNKPERSVIVCFNPRRVLVAYFPYCFMVAHVEVFQQHRFEVQSEANQQGSESGRRLHSEP